MKKIVLALALLLATASCDFLDVVPEGSPTQDDIYKTQAQAEKMQKILTPEQFEQWKQMQGPKPGMRPGPQMKDGKGCACKEGRKCDKPRPAKGRK